MLDKIKNLCRELGCGIQNVNFVNGTLTVVDQHGHEFKGTYKEAYTTCIADYNN